MIIRNLVHQIGSELNRENYIYIYFFFIFYILYISIFFVCFQKKYLAVILVFIYLVA